MGTKMKVKQWATIHGRMLSAMAVLMSGMPAFAASNQVAQVRPYWPQMQDRILRDTVASTCGSVKTYPGSAGLAGPFRYDSVGVIATATGCVTLTIAVDGAGCTSTNGVHLTAYDGRFNPADLSIGYLGDSGSSAIPTGETISIGLDVVAGQKIGLLLNTNVAGVVAPCKVTVSSADAVTDKAFTVFADQVVDGIGLPLLTTRISRNAEASACGTVKTFPGTLSTPPSVFRSFFAVSAGATCANVAFTIAGSGCVGTSVHLSGYATPFDPGNLASGYRGDSGASATVGTGALPMGIDMSAGVPLYLLVNANGTNPVAPCIGSAAAFGLVRDRIFMDGLDP
jgi:hypothetical protein